MTLHTRLTRIIGDETRQNYANETDRVDALAAAIITELTEQGELTPDNLAATPSEAQYAQWNAARWNS